MAEIFSASLIDRRELIGPKALGQGFDDTVMEKVATEMVRNPIVRAFHSFWFASDGEFHFTNPEGKRIRAFRGGVGASGDVYRDPEHQEALKLPFTSMVRDLGRAVVTFRNEMRAALELDRSGGVPEGVIVQKALAFLKTRLFVGQLLFPVLMSDWQEGTSLRKLIYKRHDQKKTQRSPQQALSLIRQIVQRVASIHARGVSHRDLTPNNLLVREDEEVKVLDLGFSSVPGASGKIKVADFLNDGQQFIFTTGYGDPSLLRIPVELSRAKYENNEGKRDRVLQELCNLFAADALQVGILCAEILSPSMRDLLRYARQTPRQKRVRERAQMIDIRKAVALGDVFDELPEAIKNALASLAHPDPDQRPPLAHVREVIDDDK